MWQPLLRSAVIKEHDYQVDNSLYSLVTYPFLKYGSVICISFDHFMWKILRIIRLFWVFTSMQLIT